MAVLQFLARHAGRVVTKDELMQAVWAGTVVTDDSLVQCVKEIRQALNDQEHRIVRTSPQARVTGWCCTARPGPTRTFTTRTVHGLNGEQP